MKNLILIIVLISNLVEAQINPYSLNEVVSIIQIDTDKYDVLCKNHAREIVTKADILTENICPYIQPVPQKEKVDILYVIDNSGSMGLLQSNFAQQSDTIINNLKAKNLDFKIAVTTTDSYYGDLFLNNGCKLCKVEQTEFRSGIKYKNKVIHENTLNAAESLSENIKVGSNGSGDERPLSSLLAAINSPLNTGFLRTGSRLEVIIFTDEEDFSHGKINLNESYSNPDLFPISKFIANLDFISKENKLKTYAVKTISVLDDECLVRLGQGRKIGLRLLDLVKANPLGKSQSICDYLN